MAVCGRILFEKLLAPDYPGRTGDRELGAEHKRRVESKRLRWNLDIPDDDEFGLGDEWYGSRRASIEASSGVWEDGLLVIQ